MIYEAAEKHNINLKKSIMIGDNISMLRLVIMQALGLTFYLKTIKHMKMLRKLKFKRSDKISLKTQTSSRMQVNLIHIL